MGMSSSGSSQGQRFMDMPKSADVNINGEVRDQDTFVLGDDEEEEENGEERTEFLDGDGAGCASISSPAPPLYESIDPWKEESLPHEVATSMSNSTCLGEGPIEADNSKPYKYYINQGDTLQGLSLRFGIDVSAYNMTIVLEQRR